MRGLKERWAFLVLAIPVILFLAVVYDKGRSDALPPTFLQYVPPNAAAFVVADHLSGAVESGGPHAGIFWPDASDDAWNTRFAEHCAGLRPADLERYGLDGDGGAAAFWWKTSAIVLALPVSDESRIIDFIRSLSAPTSRMVLTAAPSDKPVQWLRVENAEIAGVRLCNRASPIPIELKSGSRIDVASAAQQSEPDANAAEFFVVRESDHPASTKLQCVAVHADGSEGACSCTLDGEPCGSRVSDALPAAVSTSVAGIPKTIVKIGENDPSYYLHASPGIGLVAFRESKAAEDGTPRLGDDLGPLVEALQVERNIARFRNDDTYLRLLSEFVTRRRGGDTRVLASTDSTVGTMQIDASLRPDSVQLTAFTPLEQGGARIAEFLMQPAPGPIATRVDPLTGGNLTLWDPHTPDYLRYFKAYFQSRYDALMEGIGSLSVALDKLAEKRFSRIDVDLYGEKDGVPGLVVQVDMDAGDIDRYLSAVSQEMQRRHDEEILYAAWERAHAAGKVDGASTIVDLAPYLRGDEPLLDAYELYANSFYDQGDGTGKAELVIDAYFPARFADAPPEVVDLPVSEPYEKAVFLSPKISDGDIERLREDAERNIDEAGLKEGRYRLIGLASGNKVVLVTNRDTLEQFISGRQIAAAATDDNGAKLRIDADPDWLRSQLTLYPDPEVREFAGSTLGDLAGYRHLLASTRPDARLGGFVSTVLLDYDD